MPDDKTTNEGGTKDVIHHNQEMGDVRSWTGHIVRFVVSALVLMLVGYVVPGFSRMTFGTALLAAVVIALLGYIVESIGGRQISPYGHGLVGFISSAVVIYAPNLLYPDLGIYYRCTFRCASIVVDMFIPTTIR